MWLQQNKQRNAVSHATLSWDKCRVGKLFSCPSRAVLTMVKALHHSCVSHELLFHTLKELAAIKYFCKAGHPADLHQSKQCLKDSSTTPLPQWKAFPVAQASYDLNPFLSDGQALPYLFHRKLQKPYSWSLTNLLSTLNCLNNKLWRKSPKDTISVDVATSLPLVACSTVPLCCKDCD